MRTPTATAPIAASILLLGALAGCVQTDDGDDDGDLPPVPVVAEDWHARALPYGEDHTHDDLEAHRNLSTPNFRVVGWDPLVTDHHGSTSGDHLCGGISRGEREIAVVHSFSTDVAFVLADVTDPTDPQMLGEFVLKRAHTYDVDITPDGAFVVLATNPDPLAEGEPGGLLPLVRGPLDEGAGTVDERVAQRGTAMVEMQWRNACTGHTRTFHEEIPLAPGTVLVDVRDPMDPDFADFKPSPYLGPHSIHAAETQDGTVFVLASITNLAHQASYFVFYTVEVDGLLGPALADYGVVSAQYVDPDTEAPLTNGHVDGWIATHPGTGQDLAYLANWNGGLLVVDLQGPGRTPVIGAWNDYDTTDVDRPARMTGGWHSAYPLDVLWDDRHYTVVGQEVTARPAHRPTGQMLIMDTTDPAAPEPVARWTLPHDPGEWGSGESLLYSTHYATVVDETMFVATYHGGVWAVDISPDVWPELPSLGVFLPENVSPEPPEGLPAFARWSPLVLDVLRTKDGDLVLWDATSGIYVVAFDPHMQVPMPEPWTEDAWL